MKDFITTWNKQELSAYMLLFCANADYFESSEEVEIIRSKVNQRHYKEIHDEFEKDNDYQSIQKIQYALQRLNFDKTQKDELIEEIKELFLSDGNYNELEQTVYLGLKKILDI